MPVSAGVDECVLFAGASLDRAGGDGKQHHKIFMLIVCKLNCSPQLAQITPGLNSSANRWRSDDEAGPITGTATPVPQEWLISKNKKSLCGFNKLSISVFQQPAFHAGLRHTLTLYQTLVCHGN